MTESATQLYQRFATDPAKTMAENFYSILLVALGTIFVVLQFCMKKSKAQSQASSSGTFQRFQNTYLLVYLVMMAGDWLQGPTVYALYRYYGFSRQENGLLFIIGFGASLVFGPLAGVLADKYGRKLNCIVYGIAYGICCLTKHFNNFHILMVGRLFGGLATSILWSAFESWMVSEHHKNGFDPSWIGGTFSLMVVGNGMVAIGSGFAAQGAVWLYGGHPVAPFDLSLLLLVMGTLIVSLTWNENYGDASLALQAGLSNAIHAIKSDSKVFYLGMIQSFFEGAMYTFVFMWTPALENVDDLKDKIPHGFIFASFMMCVSIGGKVFDRLAAIAQPEQFMKYVFAASALCMSTPLWTSSGPLIMMSFCAFEVTVGVFWPAIGTMRSKYVPEEGRATIMNVFRTPLNAFVCLILYKQGSFTVAAVFYVCVAFHACACISQHLMEATLNAEKRLHPSSPSVEETKETDV